jgi:hypothetical protein
METSTVRLASREELLGFVPYALGFHPSESVVLLGLGRRRLELAARADADSPTREVVRAFARSLHRLRGVSQVILLGYGPVPIAGPVRTIADALEARGLHVVEALRVSGARYHCVLCDGCTPPAGVPFAGDSTAAAASAVLAGLVARPSRADVDRLVRPIGGLAAVAMTQAVERAGHRLDTVGGRVRATGRQAVDDAFAKAKAGQRLDDDEVAWLSLVLHDVEVRDHAWAATGAQAWQAELWLDLTRRADPMLVSPLATLLAWCSWRRGEGVIARSALTRALRVDPGYRLARMLEEALDEGRPPASVTWPPALE